jgi:hypothetical protein
MYGGASGPTSFHVIADFKSWHLSTSYTNPPWSRDPTPAGASWNIRFHLTRTPSLVGRHTRRFHPPSFLAFGIQVTEFVFIADEDAASWNARRKSMESEMDPKVPADSRTAR